MKYSFLLTVAHATALCATALAQVSTTAVSPEVHSDRRVTFRISAPKASEVSFKGDWQAAPEKMTRASDGLWSITLGPLAPGTGIYSFTVDGVAMADPVNPSVKLRMSGSGSLVEVPADSSTLADARDVPHGAVELNWQKSSALGDTRQIWVYTPPGYAQDRERRYPVLYLLHGGNDRPNGWIDVGHVNFIADNLIAEKRMAPMIIVMPVAYALPMFTGSTQNRAALMDYQRENSRAFEKYLARDLLPFMDTKYRVESGRGHRAVAGMSMGGGMALHVFFNHLDDFASVGAFSPARYDEMSVKHAELLADPEKTNSRIDLLWLGCGRQDKVSFGGLFEPTQALAATLAAHKIRHTWHPTDGAHNYALWREHLIEFLPLLFPSPKSSARAAK